MEKTNLYFSDVKFDQFVLIIILCIFSQGLNANSDLGLLADQFRKTASESNVKRELANIIIDKIDISNCSYKVEDVQVGILANESHIIYVVDESNIYGLLINKNEIEILYCGLDKVRAAVEMINLGNLDFRKKNYDNSIEDFLIQSNVLYHYLIAPFEDKLEAQLVIYPTDFLTGIPWDALTKSGLDSNFPHYLLLDYEITLRLKLDKISKNESTQSEIDLLSISPKYYGNLYLENEKEQEMITKGYSHVSMNGNIEKVEIVNMIMNTRSQVIHISSHAILDSLNYLNSGIVLSNSQDKLTIRNISQLKIKPKMVFVNACNSASMAGRNEFSETITAAFLLAGANSCIGTLWRIDDKVANSIALEFYKEVKQGIRSAEALRRAKLSYIENTNLRSKKHPYHWAGFQIYGQNEQLIDHDNLKIKNIYSVAFSLLTSFSMLSFYFGHKVKKLALHNNWI